MRQSVTSESLANEARMLRLDFKGYIIFVEGTSDDKFYRPHFESSKYQIIIAHNKDRVEKACEILVKEGSLRMFLGITDADFDHLNGEPLLHPVFRTDWHDVECYLINSDALERVLAETADPNLLSIWKTNKRVEDIRLHLLQQACQIGLLRWHSNKTGIGLHFKGLRIENLNVDDTMRINIQCLVEEVIRLTTNREKISCEVLLAALNHNRRLIDEAPWQLVTGDDFIQLLHYAIRTLREDSQSKLVSADQIPRLLRVAYNKSDFTGTNLYNQVTKFCSSLTELKRL